MAGNQAVQRAGDLPRVALPRVLRTGLDAPLGRLTARHAVHDVMAAVHLHALLGGTEGVHYRDVGAGAVNFGQQVGTSIAQCAEDRQQVWCWAEHHLLAGRRLGEHHIERDPIRVDDDQPSDPTGAPGRGQHRRAGQVDHRLWRLAPQEFALMAVPAQFRLAGGRFRVPRDVHAHRDERPMTARQLLQHGCSHVTLSPAGLRRNPLSTFTQGAAGQAADHRLRMRPPSHRSAVPADSVEYSPVARESRPGWPDFLPDLGISVRVG